MSDTAHRLPAILLALVLVAAQFSAVMHAYTHDPGAPQAKTCSTCITAAQLGAAAVNNSPDLILPPSTGTYFRHLQREEAHAQYPAQRQRGPPPAT
jgi:hypothetical protein